MPDRIASGSPTNHWDFLIALFERLADKGSIYGLMIILMTLGMEWIMLNSLQEEMRPEVVLSQTEMVMRYPSQRPVVAFISILTAISIIANFYQYRVYNQHVEKLLDFRRIFFHHMRDCFDFIHGKLKENNDAEWNDFKNLQPRDIVDLDQHHTSGYKLGGREK